MDLADFEVISHEQRQLLPQRWLGLGPFLNRFVAPLPGIRKLCLRTYLVGRPVRQFPDRKYSASIVIPCRNERGNIENAILRMPRFASHQEIVFVEGNSSDGTFEECDRVRLRPPGGVSLRWRRAGHACRIGSGSCGRAWRRRAEGGG